MKRLLLCALACLAVPGLQAQNLVLRSNITYPFDLANIGGYVDGQGNEYALVGTYTGLSIVDVTDPDNPFEAFDVAGAPSDWREVKTWQSYAYVTNENGGGLQIIDLSNLPTSVTPKNYTGDGAIGGQLNTIHALHIEDGVCYLYGSNLFNGAAVLLDINTDPWNPAYLGHTPSNGSNTQSYVHDGYVRNDTLYAGYIYAGEMRVYDCSNKANPVLLATQLTPGQFTHNTWLSTDGQYCFTTDEVNDSYLTAYDVSDLSNITEVGRFQTTPGSNSIVHNTHILNVNGGDYAVTSWYKDGVVITDVTRPSNMVQVGRYDTYPQGSGGGFDGDWGVYPFLPSGTIVVSDISSGLFVLTPTYVRACYLEGTVTDSVNGIPLNNALVELLTTSLSTNSVITGDYKTGTATAGTYDVQVSKAGYYSKTVTGVSLTNGLVTTLDVELVPLPNVTLTGQVLEAGTLNPIPNALVRIANSQFTNDVTTDASGNFSIAPFFPGTYDIVAGKWGWVTDCSNANIPGAGPIQIVLDKGYYDDFVFDFNWTVSGVSPNAWERDAPIGTSNMGTAANPGNDVTNDCGDLCYVTDNGGGGPWDNDVDFGNTVLTSPVFDATLFADPEVRYYRWFADIGNNGSGNPDDTMTVRLTNGLTTVTLETILPNAPGNSSWVSKVFNIKSLLPPTANMQLIVETADWGPVFNIVEGGLDKFEVNAAPLGVQETPVPGAALSAAPNPFEDEVTLTVAADAGWQRGTIEVVDLTGRIVQRLELAPRQHRYAVGRTLAPGVYLARLMVDGNPVATTQLVKAR